MIPTEKVIRSSSLLLNVRLCFYGIAFAHLAIAAVIILSVDISTNEDPEIRNYERLKWRFITAWFNFINLGYYLLSIYCDWREKQSEGDLRHVMVFRKIRDTLQTSILFPTTLFASLLFWFLYFYDISLITPVKLFQYYPHWGQHSLHTVSLVVVTLDLLLVPRRRPKSLKKRLLVMTTFFAIYTYVLARKTLSKDRLTRIYYSYMNGDNVYRILQIINGFQAFILVILFYLMYLFYFNLQWCIIDYVWKRHKDVKIN